MRIVFLGDFSGLSLFLSRGIAACGAETVLYSNGDGWKGIPRQQELWKATSKHPLVRAWNQVSGTRRISTELRDDDVIVLSTEFMFNRWIDAMLLRQVMARTSRTVLLHAGCSDGFHRLKEQTLLCRQCKTHDLQSSHCVFAQDKWPGLDGLLAHVDLVVPFTDVYTYSATAYPVPRERITPPLHFPIDFSYLASAAPAGEEHGIVHGQNRVGFKGTAYLKELMACRPSLKGLVELLPRMPFDSFLSTLASSHAVLDQLFADGYGMTGALAMAMGTTVVFGHTAEQPYACFTGPGSLPVPVTGEQQRDALALESALQCFAAAPPPARNEIRAFARQRHDHQMIGQKFLELLT